MVHTTFLKRALVCGAIAPFALGLTACGETKSKISYGAWEEITAPTCVTPGTEMRFDKKASAADILAGKAKYEERTKAALGHAYGNWTKTQEPAFQVAGSRERTCTRTHYGLPCAETGWKQVESIPALIAELCATHTYGDWTVSIPATCTATGEREQLCTVCHYQNTETITINPNAHYTGCPHGGNNSNGGQNSANNTAANNMHTTINTAITNGANLKITTDFAGYANTNTTYNGVDMFVSPNGTSYTGPADEYGKFEYYSNEVDDTVTWSKQYVSNEGAYRTADLIEHNTFLFDMANFETWAVDGSGYTCTVTNKTIGVDTGSGVETMLSFNGTASVRATRWHAELSTVYIEQSATLSLTIELGDFAFTLPTAENCATDHNFSLGSYRATTLPTASAPGTATKCCADCSLPDRNDTIEIPAYDETALSAYLGRIQSQDSTLIGHLNYDGDNNEYNTDAITDVFALLSSHNLLGVFALANFEIYDCYDQGENHGGWSYSFNCKGDNVNWNVSIWTSGNELGLSMNVYIPGEGYDHFYLQIRTAA